MKFNCDRELTEQRRYLREFWDTHVDKWTPHFAWLPIKVAEGDCRWLETVERRYVLGMWVDKSLFLQPDKEHTIRSIIRYRGEWEYRAKEESCS